MQCGMPQYGHADTATRFQNVARLILDDLQLQLMGATIEIADVQTAGLLG